MNTLYIDSNWDETPIDKNATVINDYELTDIDRLCFKCPLDDCKENSKKCLINIAKKSK